MRVSFVFHDVSAFASFVFEKKKKATFLGKVNPLEAAAKTTRSALQIFVGSGGPKLDFIHMFLTFPDDRWALPEQLGEALGSNEGHF